MCELKRCLMVKLEDSRTFFTTENNYINLLEFSNTCNAELKIVEAQSPRILSLNELIANICDHNKKSNTIKYKVLEGKKRSKIREEILNQFNKGETLKIKDLINKYRMSTSSLYRHINLAKNHLEIEGKKITKVAPGAYKISP